MITVLEAVKLSAEYLEKKGVTEARANAELMLADILKCKRLDLYLRFDTPLKESEIVIYREYLTRRSKGEPLQYITGIVGFYDLEFSVNKNVLIPRPETEILIDEILSRVPKDFAGTILDIGTGSGVIPISVLRNRNFMNAVATDISEKAIETARLNAVKNQIADRIKLVNHNILEDEPSFGLTIDIIVSNPPYVAFEEFKNLQREIKEYEPENAVTDFNDGYTFYKRISDIAPSLLNKGGRLFFEAGASQAETISRIMESAGFFNLKITKDYLGIERVVSGVLK